MTKILQPDQFEKQYSPTKTLAYKFEVKPSEASLDEEYVDITDEVVDSDVEINNEGDIGTAVIKVRSTKGAFDVVNVLSEYSSRYKKHAKVRIWSGFDTPVNLIFTGYVKLGFTAEYETAKEEIIPISLIDRAGILEQMDIISDAYPYNDSETLELIGETIGDILTDILLKKAGVLQDDIDLDLDLFNCAVDQVQFVNEDIWKVLKLCAQARMQSVIITPDNKVKTIPLSLLTTWSANARGEGTRRTSIEHLWDDTDLVSDMTVKGGIRYPSSEGTSIEVLDINPHTGRRGQGPTFLGNPQTYDSLLGQWDAGENDKRYGIGLQGTCIPRFGGEPVPGAGELRYGNFYDWDFGFPIPAGQAQTYGDQNQYEEGWVLTENEDGDEIAIYTYNHNFFEVPENWDLLIQGPFPWTLLGVPNEPYQEVKTGLGDELDDEGFFTPLNDDGGTSISINPDTVGYDPRKRGADGWGRFYSVGNKDAIGEALYYDFMKVGIGLIGTDNDWKNEEWNRTFFASNYPHPGEEYYPTEEYFYVYCISAFCWGRFYCEEYIRDDGSQQSFGLGKHYWHYYSDQDWKWQMEEEFFHRVFQWGQSWIAETTDLPEEHWVGSYRDSELFEQYGTTRIDDIENPLIFGDGSCEWVAERYSNLRKLYHAQGRFNIPLNFEIELGDVLSLLNDRTECIERIYVSRIHYNLIEGTINLTSIRGAVIDSNGTSIKGWQ